jgi:signal transduction histidine kinase
LLDISRLKVGRLVLTREVVNLSKLVKAAVELLKSDPKNASYQITLQLDDNIVAFVDRARFEQVVTNLLSNAMKYGAGKPIELVLVQIEDKVRLTVRDHGIGIAKESLGRIFGRFERAVPVNYYGGLGLGLYIAKEIILAHGGDIFAESEVGKGSTFTVEIPASEASLLTPHKQGDA